MADTEEKQEQVAAATDKEQAVQSEESSQVGSSDSEPQAERRDGTHDTKQSTPAEVLEPPASITQEADFDPAARHAPDSPTLSLITALRSQISLLTDQSSDLNAKLIAQLDRTSDLEDEIERSKAASQDQSKLIEELEAEKARWEESMNTGLLVERGTVRDEMQRLVEGLVEEERRRGSAEEGRQRVEREVDDLSATLFEQANTMVAAERLSRAQAETRMKAAEENLAAAEAAMRDMQAHLQSLPTLLPAPSLSATGAAATAHNAVGRSRRKYLAAHTPYAELASFLYHIRMLKPQHVSYATTATLPPPQISSLLTQPLLARAVTEDCDPALRLDVAPDLSYFSRRNVASAIIAGDLIIEPVGLATLMASSNAYAGAASGDIGCSLCGRSIFEPKHRPGPTTTGSSSSPRSAASATSPAARPNSTSRFSLKPFFNSPTTAAASATATSPGASPGASPLLNGHTHLPPIFVFRVSPTSSSNANTPEKERENQGRMYPLCASGWCLTRLRAVCEWWRYVRLGLIEAVWKGEDGWVHPTAGHSHPAPTRGVLVKRTSQPPTPQRESTPLPADEAAATSPPTLPPRRSGWGLGFKSLGGGSSSSSAAATSSRGLGFGKTPPQSPTAELAERDVEPIVKVDLAELTKDEPETIKRSSTEALEVPDESNQQEVRSSAGGSDTEGGSSFQTPDASQSGGSPRARRSMEAPVGEVGQPEGTPSGSLDLASPRPSADESRPSAEAATDAPTPRRPARRAAPIAPPPRQSLEKPTVVLEDDSTAPDTEGGAEPKTPDMNGPLAVATPSPAKPSSSAPPAIPPRHARQDSLNDTPTPAANKSAWKYLADEESWDNKAWKEIIRLKEEMWQARVGVHESEE